MLVLDAVSVAYGKRRALDGVSLVVRTGEIVSLLGANGSGKSSTLRAISGLVRAGAGRIVLDGRDITRAAPEAIVAAGIGHVPEGREIFPEFTVRENLLVGGHTVSRAAVADGIERALGLFPVLGQRAGQLAGTLSGGEQQMLAIARGLMAKPRILMFDEPSLGLSPLLVLNLFEIIRTLKREGLTMLLVEQNVQMSLAVSDYAYVMSHGRVEIEGPAREVRGLETVRKAYLGL